MRAWARWEGFGPVWVCWGFDGAHYWASIGRFSVTIPVAPGFMRG